MTVPTLTEKAPPHAGPGSDAGRKSEDDKHTLETPGASTYTPEIEWTEAEERTVIRKLDVSVTLLLAFGFFCFQLERGNIANAVSSTLLKDVGINQNQFNTGQGLLYLGIVLLEVPSQMILQRIGPQKWISAQVFMFGLVATFQLFMHNYSSYLGTRILLGITECGYIPGSLYVISTFYKRTELASRNACFFVGNILVSGVGGLMAAGILRLHTDKLKPWQHLFLIEGCIALFCGTVFVLFLPDSPHRPHGMLSRRLTLFTAREQEILIARLGDHGTKKEDVHRGLKSDEILGTLGNWRNYPHVLMAISLIATTAALGQYNPTLIKGFGFDTIKANALTAVGGWISLVLMILVGFTADRLRWKGPAVIIAVFPYFVMWIAFQAKSTSKDRWAKFATIALTTGFSNWWHPLNATWLSLNQPSPKHRAIAMAMFIMAANCGALVGSQLLRKDDAPLYPIGFRVCVCLVSFGFGVSIFQHFQYKRSNQRNEARVVEGYTFAPNEVEKYTP
ncbi:hypothetical protein VHUM_00631 [Vanrija humicola]|uniref:Major facilitator superfamily (MFS) profile domain-containing protein n=1 Tax=Vanrija humicola TaxID=5417 RepID=A0A7D8V110_VANHU|nr:hypothetical protein VHUM_00631 [Vanrija humicola]